MMKILEKISNPLLKQFMQDQNLREKRSEEATMKKQFESDIGRFKELKGIH